jgi:ATP-dependent RNA helicase DeaD
LIDPQHIKAPKKQVTLESITQFVVETSNRRKFDDFVKILKQNFPNKAIIFCRSRIGAHTLYEEMLAGGFNVEELHGSLTQAKREFVMTAFRNNEVKFLVATDVAARGLDVEGVTHVFNYNLPDDPESYVHRIGRTGRAGHSGVVYTLLTDKDSRRLDAIEAFIDMKINRIRVSENPVPTAQESKTRNPFKKGSTIQSTESRKSSSKQPSVRQNNNRSSLEQNRTTKKTGNTKRNSPNK